MRKIFLYLFLVIIFPLNSLFAQSNRVAFPSSELQQMALRYSGDALNWPILVNLADHDISKNTFTLSSADLLELQSLTTTSAKVTEYRNKVKSLIASGATIFARNELSEVNTLLKNYVEAIQAGNLESVLEIGEQIPQKVELLESTLNSNRLVKVQAQLNEKEGNVDKRLGLLGAWNDALVGDLFQESDGLRTLKDSYASLGFTDGSSVVVNPNTVAVIRKSRIDKLDESSDTEISLVQGGLLAKLSAAAKERSKYILNAGSSSSELKSQNFYAESDGRSTIKLTNYDGNVDVSANNVLISIKKNEGTIVKEGAAPLPPIKLLPSPELAWTSNDTIIYKQEFVFPFQTVEKASSYILQYSTSRSFDTDVTEISLRSNVYTIKNLALGKTYVKVQAIDNLGLRGPFSEPFIIERNEDNQPPVLFIDNLNGEIIFTLENSVMISGNTESGAKLIISGNRIPLQRTGKFVYQFQNLSIDQSFVISSTDGSGNATEKTIKVVKLTEATLFNLSLDGASGNEVITFSRPSVTLSSKAFPGLEVVINNEGKERIVKTDSNGRWGITMNMQQGKLSITFKDSKSGFSYLTKSFSVQAN